MDVAIVAPCPIPFTIGGAENLWRGLADFINEKTHHQAEIIKLPSREHSFWELVDSYERFSQLDLTGFDVVVTGKYPAWMIDHPNQICYMLHRLRGLYDTYHFFGLPDRLPEPPKPVAELQAVMHSHGGEREVLPEIFERLAAIRVTRLDAALYTFPGPLIREVVHFLDGVGLNPGRIRGYGAISATVRDRDGYFPPGTSPFVAHPPTGLSGGKGRDRGYLFTVSRLDEAKRVRLLLQAMEHVSRDVTLRIAGAGPLGDTLRASSMNNPRVTFEGRVSDDHLRELYAGSRAVVFVPYDEDYGYVTLEAMRAGKPVVTCSDSGGATELVEHGLTGLVSDPTPESLAAAIDQLWMSKRRARRMGRVAATRAAEVTWVPVIAQIEAAAR